MIFVDWIYFIPLVYVIIPIMAMALPYLTEKQWLGWLLWTPSLMFAIYFLNYINSTTITKFYEFYLWGTILACLATAIPLLLKLTRSWWGKKFTTKASRFKFLAISFVLLYLIPVTAPFLLDILFITETR